MAIDLTKYGVTELSNVPQPQPPGGLVNRIWNNLSQRGQALREEITKPGQSPITAGFKATAQAFGGIGDVLSETAKAVPILGKAVEKGEEVIGKGFTGLTERLSQTRLFREAAGSPEGLGKVEEVLKILGAGGEIAGNILAAEGVRASTAKLIQETSSIVKSLVTKSEANIEKNILKSFEKGVKPNLPGKTTPTQLKNYREDVITAAKTIKGNRENLRLTDEVEGTISGELPKSLQQLSEAIEQTKKSVFTQYDDLAKQAGEAGVKVELESIGSELDTVINSKSLGITNPNAIKYAKALKERLISTGQLNTTTAQDVIQNYNNSLQAFYKNPSYDATSQVAIDAMVANRLRESIDKGITELTGQKYQTLKNQYGSLKAIERDVIKASLRDARRNIKGLIDFTDVFSGGQIVSGIVNLNPGQIASGAVQKAIAEYIKFLNNPNRAIERMFGAVEKLP